MFLIKIHGTALNFPLDNLNIIGIIKIGNGVMKMKLFKLSCLVLLLVLSGSVFGKDKAEDVKKEKEQLIRSSAITIYGLDINQIINRITDERLCAVPKDCKEPPLLIWLIDNTSYIKTQKYHEALAHAISKETSRCHSFRIAVVKFASKPEIILKPTNNLETINKVVDYIYQKPDDEYKDYCGAIRFCVTSFMAYPGKKHLVLFTLQNNCIEYQLEETLQSLKGNMTLDVISGGAIFQDINYGMMPQEPNNGTLSCESANIELKFYLLGVGSNRYFYNQYVSSGYGYYGLSRLAAYSGGKYYLYYPPNNKAQSFCELHKCIWCDKKQPHNCSTAYTKLVPALAPMLVSRQYYSELYKDDALYKFLQKESQGLVKWANLSRDLKTIFGDGNSVLPSVIKQVENEIKNYDEGIKYTEKLIGQFGDKSNLRVKAHTMVFLATLYVERFNLYQYKAYLEQLNRPGNANWENGYITPIMECLCHLEISSKDKDDYVNKNKLRSDINKVITEMTMHKEMKLYGGAQGEEELANSLMGVAKTIMEYKNTPWELVARRIPITINFYIHYASPCQSKLPPPKQPPMENPPKSTTTPSQRPTPTPSPGPTPGPTPGPAPGPAPTPTPTPD